MMISKLKACASAAIALIALPSSAINAAMDFNRNVRFSSALVFDRNIESLATRRVQPAYPPMAQKYRIEGTVTVEVTVSSDGKVSKAEFVRGHNIFRSVSLDAATCHHS
jgi:outer membrane biosynthesis protein TonB